MTLYDRELDETYHSGNGAMSESRHVFIERGFHAPRSLEQTPLKLLEVGFGSGINALLTQREAESSSRPVFYESLEPYPIDEDHWEAIAQELPDEETFRSLHDAPWDCPERISPHFELLKRPIPLEEMEAGNGVALIYYDAFAAKAQPRMWASPLLDRALARALPGCIFVTYASRGSLKRSLREAGWTLEPLKGALGKREMLRARYPS